MKKENNPHSIFSQKKPWADNDHLIWLVTTINLSRNIDRFNFPGKLEGTRQKQIIELIKKSAT